MFTEVIHMCFSAGHGVTFPFSRKRTNEVISSLLTYITGIYSSQRMALPDYYLISPRMSMVIS
jgi:hypothetical protein